MIMMCTVGSVFGVLIYCKLNAVTLSLRVEIKVMQIEEFTAVQSSYHPVSVVVPVHL